jgi:hypothetical protein
MDNDYQILVNVDGEAEMNGAAKILNPPVVGKFPNLQDQLRTHLNDCFLKCNTSARQIMQVATERAEMYAHMSSEVKEAFERDKVLFNGLEG